MQRNPLPGIICNFGIVMLNFAICIPRFEFKIFLNRDQDGDQCVEWSIDFWCRWILVFLPQGGIRGNCNATRASQEISWYSTDRGINDFFLRGEKTTQLFFPSVISDNFFSVLKVERNFLDNGGDSPLISASVLTLNSVYVTGVVSLDK